MAVTKTFWVETLGCPKNQVDSDKLAGTMLADGMVPARSAADADLVVVNTCAFIDEARQESIDTVLSLSGERRDGAELVVTGCLAERHGDEVAEALPEVDRVAPFGVPVSLGAARRGLDDVVPAFDLLELPRPPASAPWAYVKVAEGCDRKCGFCAIPTFRGPQRSRSVDSILAEIESLGVVEAVLVAQDLAAFGRDQGQGERRLVELMDRASDLVERVRLLYLYPSDLTDELVAAICDTGVPYFDLSLQHVSPSLLRRMRRWGDGERFSRRMAEIRRVAPEAVFRSNFIVGYPGETEADHDLLLEFLGEARLDWCGFFAYSSEEGTYAADLDGEVPPGLVAERLAEASELQDRITAEARDRLVGADVEVLVDAPGRGRSYREAPEIDGVIKLPDDLTVGSMHTVTITESFGLDVGASPKGS